MRTRPLPDVVPSSDTGSSSWGSARATSRWRTGLGRAVGAALAFGWGVGQGLAAGAVAAEAAPPSAVAAEGVAVYRCRALDGSTLFQDRPCHQSPQTVEAARGQDGERLLIDAPPPAEDGEIAAERYRRWLAQQAAAEAAAAATAETAEKARAQAERDIAAREACAPLRDCDGAEPTAVIERYWPVFVPGTRPRRRPPIFDEPGQRPRPPPPGPRPLRPPPRVPRDARAEILDTGR